MRWLTVVVGSIVALLVVCAFAGLIYQSVSSAIDLRRNPPLGQLVDVGGYRLHLYCTGEGSPTVLLEAGAANGALSWYQAQPRIAKFTRVCSYDRAGHGWSDASPKARTPQIIAEELHTLLARAEIRGPYILVGHSVGGFYAWMFAKRYPDTVAGLVLVDSTHPDQYQRLPPGMRALEDDGQRKLAQRILEAPFGLPRIFGWEFCNGGPPAIQAALRATECRPQFYRTLRGEIGGGTGSPEFQEAAREVRNAGSLGAVPLIVIAADPDKPTPGLTPQLDVPFRRIHLEQEKELLRLSSKSKLIIARGSGHMIPFEQPEVITGSVHDLVNIVGRDAR